MAYSGGDYFGELALLDKDSLRKASIVVSSENLKVVYLSKGAFRRLLGPLEDILKRNAESYKKFVQN